MQHHDAIVGTARAAVVKDYFLALSAAHDLTSKALAEILAAKASTPPLSFGSDALDSLALGRDAALAVFNPRATRAQEVVTVAVPRADVCVFSRQNLSVAAQVTRVGGLPSGGRTDSGRPFALHFVADVAPLDVATFRVAVCVAPAPFVAPQDVKGRQFEAHNGRVQLAFDEIGRLTSVRDLSDGAAVEFVVAAEEYSSDRDGAYIFRPRGAAAAVEGSDDPLATVLIDGPIFVEVINHLSTDLSMSVTLDKHVAAATFDLNYDIRIVGGNKEIIFGVTTNSSAPLFVNDDSGFKPVLRAYDEARGISGNFFPVVTTAIAASDEPHGRGVGIGVSRPHGLGWRLVGGRVKLEVMAHRRLLQDDSPTLGLGEAMNDTTPVAGEGEGGGGLTVTGQISFMIGTAAEVGGGREGLFFRRNDLLKVAGGVGSFEVSAVDPPTCSLPPTVRLMTLQRDLDVCLFDSSLMSAERRVVCVRSTGAHGHVA